MTRSRVVFVCCDGLGRDWVRPDTTPKNRWIVRPGMLSVVRTIAIPPSAGPRNIGAPQAIALSASRHRPRAFVMLRA